MAENFTSLLIHTNDDSKDELFQVRPLDNTFGNSLLLPKCYSIILNVSLKLFSVVFVKPSLDLSEYSILMSFYNSCVTTFTSGLLVLDTIQYLLIILLHQVFLDLSTVGTAGP